MLRIIFQFVQIINNTAHLQICLTLLHSEWPKLYETFYHCLDCKARHCWQIGHFLLVIYIQSNFYLVFSVFHCLLNLPEQTETGLITESNLIFYLVFSVFHCLLNLLEQTETGLITNILSGFLCFSLSLEFTGTDRNRSNYRIKPYCA